MTSFAVKAALSKAKLEIEKKDEALRDGFAMAALTGLIAANRNPNLCHLESIRDFAESAYQIADVCMEVKKK